MKPKTIACWILIVLGAPLLAHAADAVFQPSIPRTLPQPHHDWGCEVLLCLSNPFGPTAVQECVPPIQRLWRALARGQGFPHCALNDGRDSRTRGHWAEQAVNHYDRCPDGTEPLPFGAYALPVNAPRNAPLQVGIGDGANLQPRHHRPVNSLPPVVCVGALQRTESRRIRRHGDSDVVEVGIYSNLLLLTPQASDQVIDLFIDHRLVRRVRL